MNLDANSRPKLCSCSDKTAPERASRSTLEAVRLASSLVHGAGRALENDREALVVSVPRVKTLDHRKTGPGHFEDQVFWRHAVAASVRDLRQLAPVLLRFDVDNYDQSTGSERSPEIRAHDLWFLEMVVDEPHENGIAASFCEAGVILVAEDGGDVPEVFVLGLFPDVFDQVLLDFGREDAS